MEYVYAALMLHSMGKEVNEENVNEVIKAAGEEPDESRTKSLMASLEEVDIEEAISKPVAAAAPAEATEEKEEETEEEPEEDEETEEDEEEKEEEAAEGLGTLFGE